MLKKVIICEIGLPIDTSDDAIAKITRKIQKSLQDSDAIYVDCFSEEVEEEE